MAETISCFIFHWCTLWWKGSRCGLGSSQCTNVNMFFSSLLETKKHKQSLQKIYVCLCWCQWRTSVINRMYLNASSDSQHLANYKKSNCLSVALVHKMKVEPQNLLRFLFLCCSQVVARDDDQGANSQLSYMLSGGNDEGAFSLSSSGQLSLTQTLDREAQGRYVLLITATDSGMTCTGRSSRNVPKISCLRLRSHRSRPLYHPWSGTFSGDHYFWCPYMDTLNSSKVGKTYFVMTKPVWAGSKRVF